MSYTEYYAGGWRDSPSTATPITAAALENMETGIASAASTATSSATAAAAAQATASAAIPKSTATTAGDLLYATGSGAITRLGIGVTRRVLGVVAGLPAYVESLQSLMTTTGDTLYASSANTPARVPIGSTGDVYTVVGGVPTWAAPAAASSTTELDYAAVTSNSSAITASTEGTSVAVITGTSQAYTATKKYVQVFIPGVSTAGGAVATVVLYRGSTVICAQGVPVTSFPVYLTVADTPSASTFAYSVKMFESSGTSVTMLAGAGGSGNKPPAYLRVVPA